MDLGTLDIESLSLIDDPANYQMVGDPAQGAQRFDDDLSLWAPPLLTADQDLLADKMVGDGRVRDMIKNDGFSAAGSDLYKNHTVGADFKVQPKIAWSILQHQDKLCTEVWADEAADEILEMFNLWSNSPEGWVDATRRNTLTGLLRLAMGVQLAGGEVLATIEWMTDGPRPFQTAVQMVESERLSTPPEFQFDPMVKHGIRRNKYGAPQGYYIRNAHPTDYFDTGQYSWTYVPAHNDFGRPNVIHLMEQVRIGQVRGVSRLVAAIKTTKIGQKYRDVVLQNAIVNATYAATIESELPPEAVYQQLGAAGKGVGQSVSEYAQNFMAGVAKYVDAAKNIRIDGAKIPHLYPGTKLNLQPAGKAGGLGDNFEKSLLRYAAANLGVSYEEFSRDYSSSNYSSIKAAIVETWKQMQALKALITDRFASVIYRCWLEEAINKNMLATFPARLATSANFYKGLNPEAYSNCTWIGAARGQIDELKETQAAVLRLKNNLSTYEDEIARGGRDYRKVFSQLEKEKEDMQARDIWVEDSNMMNAASGAVREPEDNDEARALPGGIDHRA